MQTHVHQFVHRGDTSASCHHRNDAKPNERCTNQHAHGKLGGLRGLFMVYLLTG